MLRYTPGILIIFFLIIFSGCATKEGVRKAEEDTLKERVMEYWRHKINGEFDKCYEYEEPFYRKTVNLVKYIKGFRTDVIKWKTADVREMEIRGDEAVVKLNVDMNVKVPGIRRIDRTSLVTEKWVRVEGIWYHVPERAAGRKD